MRYLLDTDALIDFSKGVQPTTALILSWIDGNDTVAICPITVAEFYAGLTSDLAFTWKAFLASLPYWRISREAAMRAGQDRYSLARAGTTVAITDALLAAVAREHEATLVTGNVRDFPTKGINVLALR